MPNPLPAPSGSAKLARAAAEIVATYEVTPETPGLSVLVMQPERILHMAGYGLARLDGQVANTPHSIFHMASTGKQFTALGLLMLEEEGRIELDAPVTRYLPKLVFEHKVTLRQLLTHTGGIPEYADYLESEAPTNADMLALFESEGWEELDFKPGRKYSYSNPGYELLGSVIEAVTQQSFSAFMQARIFDPLGMTQTFSYSPKALRNPQRAFGYELKRKHFTLLDADPLDAIYGSGSIYAPVTDLFLYDQALSTDRLLPHARLQEAFTPGTLANGEALEYGLGWELWDYGGYAGISHSGEWIGYVSYYARFPEVNLTVIALANRNDLDVESLTLELTDLYWPE